MAKRGEKHFNKGGRNMSQRKYIHIVVVDKESDKLEIPVSCRPARAHKALTRIRTRYGNGRLEKRNKVA